ncbi:glutamate-rich protein 1 isoform X2 [Hippocampus comes]|uniref:glutamate-rich protein 1 isoform X2 n=1 Tax=Hippocampus comes TaxID=109280 RepID=UPI00094E5FC4|nr:PREDICTED: glutamate-rich protein 1-like isoform X2 [Hippocampus comes]
MAHRKEVFQSKVLQKLYPAAPKLEKELSPSCILADALVKKKQVKRKTQQDIPHSNATMTPSAAIRRRKMYTVLPPPEDFDAESVKCVTLSKLESTKSGEGPSEHDIQECSQELDQEVETNEQKRRRKRRKGRLNLHADKDGTTSTIVSSFVQIGTLMDEEGVRMSRNKKRKLKKKRHKEKMLSMGLMPRASALEFTYQRENEEDEEEEEKEEEDGMRAAEVADFLRTTMEIYKSDSFLHGEKLPHLPGVLEDLLSGIASGSKPAPLLKHLHILKRCIQHKDTDTLGKALQDLNNNTLMSADPGLPQCVCGTSTREDHAWHGYASRRRGDRHVRVQLQAIGSQPSTFQPCAAECWLTYRC